MPNPKQHEEKAELNQQFLICIVDDSYCDWKATATFYVAVHYVEKLRAYDGGHSVSHDDRDRYVRSTHSKIYSPYHQLFNFSLIARYDSCHAAATRIEKYPQLKKYLNEVRNYVDNESAAKSSGS